MPHQCVSSSTQNACAAPRSWRRSRSAVKFTRMVLDFAAFRQPYAWLQTHTLLQRCLAAQYSAHVEEGPFAAPSRKCRWELNGCTKPKGRHPAPSSPLALNHGAGGRALKSAPRLTSERCTLRTPLNLTRAEYTEWERFAQGRVRGARWSTFLLAAQLAWLGLLRGRSCSRPLHVVSRSSACLAGPD